MTDKEKADLLLHAIRDIQRTLASLASLPSMPKDDALKAFSDTYEVIGKVCVSAEQQVTLQ